MRFFLLFGLCLTVLFSWVLCNGSQGKQRLLVHEPSTTMASQVRRFPSHFERFQPLPTAVKRFQMPLATRRQANDGPKIEASSTVPGPAQPEIPQIKSSGPPNVKVSPPLACPVSFQALDSSGFCVRSGLQYAEEDGRWDLTIGAAINTRKTDPVSISDVARSLLPKELRGLLPQSGYVGTRTFETPQVAWAYERGWRQNFARVGFPGPDEEIKLAEAALRPFADGKVLVDVSCGSGLFTRRFVKSGKYGHVIALDFSDAMLRQARSFAAQEGLLKENLTFVRADVGRLPFPEGSIGGIHAGAAIHCWPDPRTAVAEIARVLEPGATFCGTTFLTAQIPFVDDTVQQAVDTARRDLSPARRASFRQWNKKDLHDLMMESGLTDFKSDIQRGFIFYRATRPFIAA